MATSHRAMRMALLKFRQPATHFPRTFATTHNLASDAKSKLPTNDGDASGPNMQQQEHVSEEAAKMAKITGGTGPDLSQGTPVQEILKADPEAQKTAPQVMKDSIKSNKPSPKPQTRTFSTFARRRTAMDLGSSSSAGVPLPPSMLSTTLPVLSPTPSTTLETVPSTSDTTETVSSPGHKFGLPTLPIPATYRKSSRTTPIIEQFTNLIMKHGRKSVAQRIMGNVMTHLQTSPAPTYSTKRLLAAGAPPASYLPLHPVTYISLAVDSIAPLLRVRSQRGAAGGGVALQIPMALNERQRRRKAIGWILDAADAKPSRGSGKRYQGVRIAEEIVAIVEGKSSAWEKKAALHKVATTARINIGYRPQKKR